MQEKSRSLTISKFVMTFAAVFIMTLAIGMQTKAANTPAAVSGVKQTGANSSTVGLEWTALLDNGVDYEVWISSSANGKYYQRKTSTYGNDTMISDLSAGATYYVKVRAYVKDENYNTIYGGYSTPLEVVTAPNSAPSTIKHTKSTTSSISVSWGKVSGANCYAVLYGKAYQDPQNYKLKYVTGTSTSLTKLSKNELYTVYVYGVRKTSNSSVKALGPGKYIRGLPVTPGKAGGINCSRYWQTLSEIKVECNQMKAADGYQWELYTSYKKKDTRVKSVTSGLNYANIKHSALKKYNFYKVRVRAYCVNSSGKKYYGAWSGWKYVSPQPDIKMKSTSSGLKTSWDKITGADRYVVYISTKQNSGYKKYCTTTKTSTTIKKCGSSKLKSGRKYYVYVVAQNKVGGKYYSGDTSYCWSLTYRK